MPFFDVAALLPLGTLALLSAFLLTPRVGRLSVFLGAVDLPDGGRHLHQKATPRAGGLSIILAFFLTLSLFFVFFREAKAGGLCFALALGGSGSAACGLLDDMYGLSVSQKLSLSLVSCGIALLPSLRFGTPFFLLSLPASLFLLLSLMNAQNFIDGMDGLSPGLSALSLGFLSLYAFALEELAVGAMSLFLLFSVLGFLPHNLPPARIFMGDTGSLFLGFCEGIFILSLAEKGGSLWLLLFFVAVPLFDLFFVVTRRLLSGSSPFTADRRHLHHFLSDIGGGELSVPLILYTLSAFVGLLGVLFLLF